MKLKERDKKRTTLTGSVRNRRIPAGSAHLEVPCVTDCFSLQEHTTQAFATSACKWSWPKAAQVKLLGGGGGGKVHDRVVVSLFCCSQVW